MHCWADKEEPFNFPSKGKLLTFGAVKHKLESRETDKQVTATLLIDIIMNAKNDGQEVLGQLLLHVSLISSMSLTEKAHGGLSAVHLLYSRGSTDRVNKKVADCYGDAFTSDVRAAAARQLHDDDGNDSDAEPGAGIPPFDD